MKTLLSFTYILNAFVVAAYKFAKKSVTLSFENRNAEPEDAKEKDKKWGGETKKTKKQD